MRLRACCYGRCKKSPASNIQCAKSESAGVAQKLIATSSDLDALAGGDRSVAALKGWRGEVFGQDALRLCRGEIALSAKGGAVRVVNV